jgi:hypothetical protein
MPRENRNRRGVHRRSWIAHHADEMTETPVREPSTFRPEPVRTRIALAIEICCARPTLRRTARIAAVVGVVLTGINEGDSLVHREVTAATGIEIALNFLVPFVASNLGVLAGTRRG